MGTSKESQIKTFKVLFLKLLAPTFPRPTSLAQQVKTTFLFFVNQGLGVSFTILIISDPKKTLGIKLPYLVMIIKNMKKYFTFEVQVGLETGKQFSPWKPTTKFSGAGRQKCAKEIPGIKLPVNYQVQIHIKVLLCEFSSTG